MVQKINWNRWWWWRRRNELQPRQRCRAAINYGFGYCHENGAVAMRERERQPRMIPGNDEDENEEEGTQYNGEEKYRGHNTILIWSFAADHNGGGPRWSTTRPEDDRRPALLEADHTHATAHATVGPLSSNCLQYCNIYIMIGFHYQTSSPPPFLFPPLFFWKRPTGFTRKHQKISAVSMCAPRRRSRVDSYAHRLRWNL